MALPVSFKKTDGARLVLIMMLVGLANSMTSRFLPIYGLDYLGMSAQLYGTFLVATSGVAFVATLGTGLAADNAFNRVIVLNLVISSGIIGFTLIGVLPNQVIFISASLLFLSLSGASAPQIFGIARAKQDEKVAGPDVSHLRAVFAACWIVGPPISGILIGATGFQTAFLLAAGLHLLAFITALSLKPIAPLIKEADQNRLKFRARYRSGFYLSVVAFVLINTGLGLHSICLPLIVVSQVSGSMFDVGVVSAVSALLEIPAMLAWGRYFQSSKCVVLSFNAVLYAVYLSTLSVASSLWTLIGLQLLCAISTAALLSLSISYFQDIFPTRPSFGATLFSVSKIAGTALSGMLFSSLNVASGYGKLMLFAAALTSFAGVLLFYSFLFGKKISLGGSS